MSSASKTPNLNLPQWAANEKPERTDFNTAFDSIDDIIRSGTWTPTIVGNTTAGTQTYTTQAGTWTRIGSRVIVDGYIYCAIGSTAAGVTRIEGLPFNIDNNGAAWVSDLSGATLISGRQLGISVFGGVKYMVVKSIGSSSTPFQIEGLSSPFLIRFGATYITNDA